MTIPGYDPADLEEELAAALAEADRSDYLSDEEWAAFQRDEASLVDLLAAEAISELIALRRSSAP